MRTIQLPQSVWFEQEENQNRVRRLVEQHRDFTLLVRERDSENRAQTAFDVPIQLCPDLAFGLGNFARAKAATVPLVFLRRGDKESRGWGEASLPNGTLDLDWTAEEQASLPTDGAESSDERFTALARHRLSGGRQVLETGRVVMTDRLHAHVLSLLLGIPHVVLDNSYGKLHSTVETWTGGSPLVNVGESLPHAIVLAEKLLAAQQ